MGGIAGSYGTSILRQLHNFSIMVVLIYISTYSAQTFLFLQIWIFNFLGFPFMASVNFITHTYVYMHIFFINPEY